MGLCLFSGKNSKYSPFLIEIGGGVFILGPPLFWGRYRFFFLYIDTPMLKGVTPLTSFNDYL